MQKGCGLVRHNSGVWQTGEPQTESEPANTEEPQPTKTEEPQPTKTEEQQSPQTPLTPLQSTLEYGEVEALPTDDEYSSASDDEEHKAKQKKKTKQKCKDKTTTPPASPTRPDESFTSLKGEQLALFLAGGGQEKAEDKEQKQAKEHKQEQEQEEKAEDKEQKQAEDKAMFAAFVWSRKKKMAQKDKPTDKEQKAEDKEQKAEDKEHEKGTDSLDPVWVNGHVRSMLIESTRVEETSSEEDEEPEPRKRKKQKKGKE